MDHNKVPRKLTSREKERLVEVSEELHKKDPAHRRKANLDFFIYLIVMLVVVFSLRQFVGEPIMVDGPSMDYTLASGERMLVEKVSYLVKEPERGDIIICYYPGYDVSCVKRVIGLPGDTVEIRGGITYLNGEPLDESEWTAEPFMWYDYAGTIVPKDHVFVMGDNRNNSKDSRDPSVGCIPYERIVGRAIAVIWPFSEFRSLT